MNKEWFAATLSDAGYPTACAGGAACTYDQLKTTLTDAGDRSDPELVEIYTNMKGHMALFGLRPDINLSLLHDITSGILPDTSQTINLGTPIDGWFQNIKK